MKPTRPTTTRIQPTVLTLTDPGCVGGTARARMKPTATMMRLTRKPMAAFVPGSPKSNQTSERDRPRGAGRDVERVRARRDETRAAGGAVAVVELHEGRVPGTRGDIELVEAVGIRLRGP